MSLLRLSPSISITLGLVSLTLLMFFMLDTVVGVVPDNRAQVREIREKVSTNLALQLGSLLQTDDREILRETLARVQQRNDDILSLGIRTKNGKLIAQSGFHQKFWTPPPDGKSTLTHVQIPVYMSDRIWGTIEISFKRPEAVSLLAWLKQPDVALPVSILFFGSILYYLYLRRVLNHLDPTRVIPDRVNAALDTLTEGVMIIDRRENILLVNDGFKKLHPEAVKACLGKKVKQLKWLFQAVSAQTSVLPWRQVMETEKPVNHASLRIPQPNGKVRIVSLNAAPVRDSQGKVQGCLVTFSDVTERERANSKLRMALTRLQESQSKIEQQNRELQRLANYDQLTGILNRRAFFERAGEVLKFCVQSRMSLVCIMSDIDHFKAINDNYGHPVGDAAIKVVASLLSKNTRHNDVVGRYGGEEFCIVLPGIDEIRGHEIANRMRENIERLAGKGVRSVEGLRITSSFGMSVQTSATQTLGELIELADRALYHAKENGRNQVAILNDPEDTPRLSPRASVQIEQEAVTDAR